MENISQDSPALNDSKKSGRNPVNLFLIIIWPYVVNDFFTVYSDLSGASWVLIPSEILYVVIPGITIWLMCRKGYLQMDALGWPGITDLFDEEIFALLYFIIFYFVFLKGIDLWLGKVVQINPGFQLWSFHRPDAYDEGVNWPLVFYYALTAGLYEEVIFRGIYTKLFRKFFKHKVTFFLTGAAFFSMAHWCNGPQNLILTFFWGLGALIVYSYRRKLLSLILMHAAYDIVIFGRLA